MLRSLSVQVLIALGLGLVCGEAILIYGGDDFKAVLDGVQAVGSLWLNALRMTVVPLIFSLLVTGIASVADVASTGRLALRSVLLFGGLILVAALYGTGMAQFLLSVWPVDPAQAQAFVASAAPADKDQLVPPSLSAWLAALAPANPLRAAADDAILQLVIFAVFFGFAARNACKRRCAARCRALRLQLKRSPHISIQITCAASQSPGNAGARMRANWRARPRA